MLSFIIVEYHSADEANRCAEAILAAMQAETEVIISSNSCYTPQQRNQLPATSQHVRWLFNERNGGFAYAMNRGLEAAKGQHLVIMNSDCLVNADLTPLADFLDRHPEVGAVAPRLCDTQGVTQDTARPYVSLQRHARRTLRRLFFRQELVMERRMNYNLLQTVDWVIGAFIMVSRRAYELTGGLDESYFLYAEDLDWCTRIRKSGLEVVYYPRLTVVYKGTRRARRSLKYARIFLRSHLIYWHRFGFFSGYPRRREIDFSQEPPPRLIPLF